jgi:hypothetical protein
LGSFGRRRYRMTIKRPDMALMNAAVYKTQKRLEAVTEAMRQKIRNESMFECPKCNHVEKLWNLYVTKVIRHNPWGSWIDGPKPIDRYEIECPSCKQVTTYPPDNFLLHTNGVLLFRGERTDFDIVQG